MMSFSNRQKCFKFLYFSMKNLKKCYIFIVGQYFVKKQVSQLYVQHRLNCKENKKFFFSIAQKNKVTQKNIFCFGKMSASIINVSLQNYNYNELVFCKLADCNVSLGDFTFDHNGRLSWRMAYI